MSKPWKGWIDDDHDDDLRWLVIEEGDPSHPNAVIVTPIEDESLPHPGDGREWTWTPVFNKPVEILTPPVGEHPTIVLVRTENDRVRMADVCDLRERQPEHKPWCDYTGDPICTCSAGDRRSGEEQRKGERREHWPRPISLLDRRRSGSDMFLARRGRRTGTDRRQS